MAASSRIRSVDSRRLVVAVLMTAALAWPALPLAQQPPKSLGEIAREEAERRKALKGPSKVYTKDDLPKHALLSPTPPGTQAPSGDPATADPDAAKGEAADKAGQPEQKDEAWWRKRMTDAREALRRNEMFAQAIQTRINSLAADFASRDDPLQRTQVAIERNKALAELDALTKEIKEQQKQVADIEAEARRAGVPPGWLR